MTLDKLNIHTDSPEVKKHDGAEESAEAAKQFAFPQFEPARRIASPLPSPLFPGVSSAFEKGTSVFDIKAPIPVKPDVAPNMERRQSAPCLSVPSHVRNPDFVPRYSHLTFFVSGCHARLTLAECEQYTS